MIGDKLASGASSATFIGPRLKFNDQEMQLDLGRLPALSFMDKYMITQREYEMLLSSTGEKTNMLIKQAQDHIEAIERLTQQDKKEDAALERECFITPFFEFGWSGRIIVSRDQPVLRQSQSKLALPRHLRQQREHLPTTGHILIARVFDSCGHPVDDLIGKRILFGPMSGTAVCFSNYPTWIILDVGEILGIINKEDAEVVEQELEPIT